MEKKIQTRKQRKGITLIALVLTIIVLLILAGITINLTIGQDGIIKRAEEAGQTYKEAEANEIAQLGSFEASVIPGKVAKTLDGVQYVGDGMGNIIPVPVGFSYLEGTKSTGFVIKHDTDGNEFVWVPCNIDGANGTIKYDRYAFTRDGWEYNQILNVSTGEIKQGKVSYVYTQVIPSDEQISVQKYEGFYIGRYETGITGYTNVNKSTTNTEKEYTGYEGGNAVIKPEQQVWNYITRDEAKKISENLYNKTKGDSINSKLCSSYAWDTTLKFIETKNLNYATNSSQGNYLDKSAALGKPSKTGVTENVNNIYDMGGNTWEWTTEEYSYEGSEGTIRGGNYSHSSNIMPAAYRGYTSTATANGNVSFRTTLYF